MFLQFVSWYRGKNDFYRRWLDFVEPDNKSLPFYFSFFRVIKFFVWIFKWNCFCSDFFSDWLLPCFYFFIEIWDNFQLNWICSCEVCISSGCLNLPWYFPCETFGFKLRCYFCVQGNSQFFAFFKLKLFYVQLGFYNLLKLIRQGRFWFYCCFLQRPLNLRFFI